MPFRIPVGTQEPIRTVSEISERIEPVTKVTSQIVHSNVTGNGTIEIAPPVGHFYRIRSIFFGIAGAGVTNPVLTVYMLSRRDGGTPWSLHEMTYIGDGVDKTMTINLYPNASSWNVYNDPIRKIQASIPAFDLQDRISIYFAYFGATTQYRILYDDYEVRV